MRIAVIAGDGIGPEIMNEGLKILHATSQIYKFDMRLELKEALMGGCAYDVHGTPLPKETVQICEESDAVLFGAAGGPKWEKLPPELQPERGALLPLRKHFSLFANLRPVRVYPALADTCPLKNELISGGIDIIFFRELTGGLYFGQPKKISEDRQSAVDTMVYTKEEVERIARKAFEAARLRKNKLTSIDKANVLMTSILWRETVIELHQKEYSDVELNHLYVDNASMQLVRNPSQFDVVVTENMFGDILSDEAAMLAGSLGMLPSASINKNGFGLYEPISGTAPDIAGKGIANPIAQILSVALMLRYTFGLEEPAVAIEKAVNEALEQGYRTGDIFKNKPGEQLVGTIAMGDAIERLLK